MSVFFGIYLYMKILVENRIVEEKVSEGLIKVIIVIVYGNGSGCFMKVYDELKVFVKMFDSYYFVYVRVLYGILVFKNDLDKILE